MVGTLAPGGVSVEMAKPRGDAARESVTLMPDRSLGFEHALVFVEFAAVKGRVQVFGILAEEGDEVLQHGIEPFIAAGQGGTMRDAVEADYLPPIQVGEQPPMLGFESDNASKLHDDKAHDEGRVRVLEGMAPMRTHRLLL